MFSMRVTTVVGVLASVLLAACTARVTPPKVEIETAPSVQVEVGASHGAGGFCPPGQQKKGRC
jgi:outer membrane biogenesis lipoprotein LolB